MLCFSGEILLRPARSIATPMHAKMLAKKTKKSRCSGFGSLYAARPNILRRCRVARPYRVDTEFLITDTPSAQGESRARRASSVPAIPNFQTEK